MKIWDLDKGLLESLGGFSVGWRRGSCREPRAASYKRRSRREKEGIQECRKPAIPRNDKTFFFVEGTARDWIRFFLSMVIAFWVGLIVNPK